MKKYPSWSRKSAITFKTRFLKIISKLPSHICLIAAPPLFEKFNENMTLIKVSVNGIF